MKLFLTYGWKVILFCQIPERFVTHVNRKQMMVHTAYIRLDKETPGRGSIYV